VARATISPVKTARKTKTPSTAVRLAPLYMSGRRA
jgi:hypothetical protein